MHEGEAQPSPFFILPGLSIKMFFPELPMEHCHYGDEPMPQAKAASEAWRDEAIPAFPQQSLMSLRDT